MNTQLQNGILKVIEPVVYSSSSPIQSFSLLQKDTIIVITEDYKLTKVKLNEKSATKLKSVDVHEQTIPSTIYTDVASKHDAIVVAGYRDHTGSSVYYLLNNELNLLDTIEVKNIDTTKKGEDHHVHKMNFFNRVGLLHLFSINIACSVNLFVINNNKIHPISVATRICDGKHFIIQTI